MTTGFCPHGWPIFDCVHCSPPDKGSYQGIYGQDYEDPYVDSGTGTRLGHVLKRSELSSLPRIRPLIKDVMSQPASIVLVGGYGLGKTFLALSFGCSVANGLPWLGREVDQRRVLFCIGEGAYGLEARVAAWEAAWNKGRPIPDEQLTFVAKPSSLKDVGVWRELTELAIGGGYGLVILDTFSSLAPDADETKDAALTMRRLSDLSTAIDGTAMLVHHPGWSDANRSRGGYQIEANADEVLILNGVSEGSDLISLTRKKVKDGPDGAVLWLARRRCADSMVIEVVAADEATVPIRERAVAVLTNYGDIGATGPQLMAELGIDDKGRSGFYRALRKLKDAGEVTERGPGHARRYFIVTPGSGQ